MPDTISEHDEKELNLKVIFEYPDDKLSIINHDIETRTQNVPHTWLFDLYLIELVYLLEYVIYYSLL